MKFKLSIPMFFYNEKEKKKLEKLGFEFNRVPCFEGKYEKTDKTPIIEINSLTELTGFVKKTHPVLIERCKDGFEICLVPKGRVEFHNDCFKNIRYSVK